MRLCCTQRSYRITSLLWARSASVGIEPAQAVDKTAALSTELRGRGPGLARARHGFHVGADNARAPLTACLASALIALGVMSGGADDLLQGEIVVDGAAAVGTENDRRDSEGDEHDAGGDAAVLEELACGEHGDSFRFVPFHAPSLDRRCFAGIRPLPPTRCGFPAGVARVLAGPVRANRALRLACDGERP